MKKFWIAALTALVLAVALLPGTALAASDSGTAGSRLTGVDRAIYDVLKTEVIQVASGRRTSTAISIPDQPALSWTVSELTEGGGGDVLARLKDKFAQTVHMDLIYTCLTSDLPYEMFWKGNQFTWGYSTSRTGNKVSIRNLTIHLMAAQDYRAGSSTTVSTAKVSAAARAADNARAIVAKYRDKPDHEKLAAYLQEICQLAAYDHAAGRGAVPYGDPWQLVYVFDGDPATNVVCEGYAKAFQYLCDLSDFRGNVLCRTVTGTINGGSHMWNVVRMDDGENYLVDVTNCDSGTVGAPDTLFLTGATAQDGGRTYSVSKGVCRVAYTYADEQKDLFTDGYLTLSASDYVYDPSRVPAAPAFTDVVLGAYYADAVAWAVEQGITNGTSETTFSPDRACTEAEVLTFLWRAAGRPDSQYKASEENPAFWQDALLWFYDIGMIQPDGSFDPGLPCTRVSAVNSIWWAFRHPDSNRASGFADVPEAYAGAVAWAVEREITNGTSETTFSPFDGCTRGQIVTFLYRAYHESAS